MKLSRVRIQALRGPAGVFLAIPADGSTLDEIRDDVDYNIEIKRYSPKRSMRANAYCWALCQDIACALSNNGTYISKEDVYQKAVRDSQMFDYVLVPSYSADGFKRRYDGIGIGWQAVFDSVQGNMTKFALFTGSSAYNRIEMGRLLNCLVDEANQLGIDTRESDEVKALLESEGE